MLPKICSAKVIKKELKLNGSSGKIIQEVQCIYRTTGVLNK
jgi:hypothetical protein